MKRAFFVIMLFLMISQTADGSGTKEADIYAEEKIEIIRNLELLREMDVLNNMELLENYDTVEEMKWAGPRRDDIDEISY